MLPDHLFPYLRGSPPEEYVYSPEDTYTHTHIDNSLLLSKRDKFQDSQ